MLCFGLLDAFVLCIESQIDKSGCSNTIKTAEYLLRHLAIDS